VLLGISFSKTLVVIPVKSCLVGRKYRGGGGGGGGWGKGGVVGAAPEGVEGGGGGGGEMGRRAVIVAATNRVEAISVSGREVSPLPSRITKCISVHVWCTESRRKWRGWW